MAEIIKTKKEVESDIFERLLERFSSPEWAILPQVRDSTGFQSNRTADAIAMNLYPSRGLELHGFEIKVSRADWLRELKHPEKSVDIQKYCNRWWLAVSNKKIVAEGELPAAWGLLVPYRNSMKAVKAAPELEAESMDKAFVASILFKRFDPCIRTSADCNFHESDTCRIYQSHTLVSRRRHRQKRWTAKMWLHEAQNN